MGDDATTSSYTGPTASPKGQTTKKVFALVDYMLLPRLEHESIRVFFNRYDAYNTEVKACATQATSKDSTSEERCCSLSLAFCVDPDQLESALECCTIPD